jgi:hypothetical protein
MGYCYSCYFYRFSFSLLIGFSDDDSVDKLHGLLSSAFALPRSIDSGKLASRPSYI